jgi:hypothetical protein
MGPFNEDRTSGFAPAQNCSGIGRLFIFIGNYQKRNHLYDKDLATHPTFKKALLAQVPQYASLADNAIFVPPQIWYDKVIDDRMTKDNELSPVIHMAMHLCLTKHFGLIDEQNNLMNMLQNGTYVKVAQAKAAVFYMPITTQIPKSNAGSCARCGGTLFRGDGYQLSNAFVYSAPAYRNEIKARLIESVRTKVDADLLCETFIDNMMWKDEQKSKGICSNCLKLFI